MTSPRRPLRGWPLAAGWLAGRGVEVAHRSGGMRGGRPVGALRPVLALPDGHRLLQRVDREASRLERLGPVGRRGDDHDRGFGQPEVADPVQQREALDVGPAAAGLGRDLLETARRDVLVGLVAQTRHAVTTFRVVADDPEEAHDRAARGRRRPTVDGVDGEGLTREADPVTHGRRLEHARYRR